MPIVSTKCINYVDLINKTICLSDFCLSSLLFTSSVLTMSYADPLFIADKITCRWRCPLQSLIWKLHHFGPLRCLLWCRGQVSGPDVSQFQQNLWLHQDPVNKQWYHCRVCWAGCCTFVVHLLSVKITCFGLLSGFWELSAQKLTVLDLATNQSI